MRSSSRPTPRARPSRRCRPPSLHDAGYELALAYRALGRSADAERLLARLAEEPAGPVAADARFLLGQAHVEAGRFAEAIAPLERYLADNPRGDVAEFALADLVAAQLGAGRADAAAQTLANLARQFPDGKALPRARLRFAEAALAARTFDRAAEQFRLVAGTVQPGDRPRAAPGSATSVDRAVRVRALAGLGRALQELGRPAESASAFGAVLELAPNDPIAPEMALARAHALESANRADDALDRLCRGRDQFAGRDEGPARHRRMRGCWRSSAGTGNAADEYERLVDDPRARDPLAKAGATPDVLLAEMGWALFDASKTADADRVFTRLLKDYPDSPHAADARFNLAESANQGAPLYGGDSPADPTGRRQADRGSSSSRAGRRSRPTGSCRPSFIGWAGRRSRSATGRPRRQPSTGCSPSSRRIRIAARLASCAPRRPCNSGTPPPPRPGSPLSWPSRLAPTILRASADRSDWNRVRCWVALERWKDLVPAVQGLRGELKPDDPGIAELDYALGQAPAWVAAGWKRRGGRFRR